MKKMIVFILSFIGLSHAMDRNFVEFVQTLPHSQYAGILDKNTFFAIHAVEENQVELWYITLQKEDKKKNIKVKEYVQKRNGSAKVVSEEGMEFHFPSRLRTQNPFVIQNQCQQNIEEAWYVFGGRWQKYTSFNMN